MATKKTAKKTVKKTAGKTAKSTLKKAPARTLKQATRARRGGDLVVHASDKTLKKAILTSTLPVLVDFSATWCEPCKALAKALPAIAEKFEGRVKVVKIDIDESPKATADFSIEGVPTLVLFHRGNLLGVDDGFCSRRATEDWLGKALAGGKRRPKRGSGCSCCG